MHFLKKNKWIVLLLIVLVGGFSIYSYLYQPHTTTEELTVDFKGSSEDFLLKVQEDFDAWNNKAIEISGTITAKDENGIILDNQIYCQFRNDFSSENLKENEAVTLKGRVIGYDDLLEELKLNQCILK